MNQIYLFDWGDTLMHDFPDQTGKMCNWVTVQTVDGATETLSELSKSHSIYIATNAADSTESDIESAFLRVGLAQFITGYFCKANLGIGKGTPEFFHKIVEHLGVSPDSIVMVGDNYSKDIEPAITAGIQAIWLNAEGVGGVVNGVRQIARLTELCA